MLGFRALRELGLLLGWSWHWSRSVASVAVLVMALAVAVAMAAAVSQAVLGFRAKPAAGLVT